MNARSSAPGLRAVISALLVVLLILQAGCTAAVGPPTPIRPDDPEQRRAIGNARELRVRTRSGDTHRLHGPSIADSRLSGRSTETLPARELAIPLDSIAEVQLYELSPARTALGALLGVTAVLALGSLVFRDYLDIRVPMPQ